MANESWIVNAERLTTKLHAECAGCKVVRKIQCSACWVNDVLDMLEDSVVDAAEVVHGRWIEHIEMGAMNNHYECSACHWKTPSFTIAKGSNYCPNCGAKMDGDGNG